MNRLGWSDYVLEPDAAAPVDRWLAPWAAFCQGSFRVRFLNRFGCFFLERRNGLCEMLDVFYGQLEPLAASPAEFETLKADPAWREVYLLAGYVRRLHAAGRIAEGEECYALAPPPLFGGPDPWGTPPLAVESAMVMEVELLQGLYAHHVAKSLEAD